MQAFNFILCTVDLDFYVSCYWQVCLSMKDISMWLNCPFISCLFDNNSLRILLILNLKAFLLRKHFFFSVRKWLQSFSSQCLYSNIGLLLWSRVFLYLFSSVTVDFAIQVITAMELVSERIFSFNPEENKDLSFALSWCLYTSLFYCCALVRYSH